MPIRTIFFFIALIQVSLQAYSEQQEHTQAVQVYNAAAQLFLTPTASSFYAFTQSNLSIESYFCNNKAKIIKALTALNIKLSDQTIKNISGNNQKISNLFEYLQEKSPELKSVITCFKKIHDLEKMLQQDISVTQASAILHQALDAALELDAALLALSKIAALLVVIPFILSFFSITYLTPKAASQEALSLSQIVAQRSLLASWINAKSIIKISSAIERSSSALFAQQIELMIEYIKALKKVLDQDRLKKTKDMMLQEIVNQPDNNGKTLLCKLANHPNTSSIYYARYLIQACGANPRRAHATLQAQARKNGTTPEISEMAKLFAAA